MSAQILVCTCGFLAPALLALQGPVQVASKVLPPPAQALEAAAGGYPIAFDGLATNVAPVGPSGPSFLDEADLIAGYPRRLLRYEVTEHAGLGDRLTVIATLLSIATEFNAWLAFPDPKDALGASHGNSSAFWWDEYVVTRPVFAPADKVECAPYATTFNITNKADFDRLVQSEDELLHHQDAPICIRLQEHYFTLMENDVFRNLVDKGAPAVSMWTSNKVATLARRVKTELKTARYNAMHVRLGDKATPLCSTATHVAESAYEICQANPEYAEEPWFLMSDGEAQFFEDMHVAMREKGFPLITERDLTALDSITDNFLVFSALECIFAAADIALMTYKNLGHRCMPEAEHAVTPRFIDCRGGPPPSSGPREAQRLDENSTSA